MNEFELINQLAQKEQHLRSAENALIEKDSQIDELTKKLVSVNKDLNTRRTAWANEVAKNISLTQQVRDLQEKVKELTVKYESAYNENLRKAFRIHSLKVENKTLTNKIVKLESENAKNDSDANRFLEVALKLKARLDKA